MLRITRAVSEVRAWASARGAWPCRRLDGRLALGFPNETCRGVGIGWAEFEVNFVARRSVLAWDDAPGSTRAFVFSEREAHRFLADEPGSTAPSRPARAAQAAAPPA
jgi:hypothetical protein